MRLTRRLARRLRQRFTRPVFGPAFAILVPAVVLIALASPVHTAGPSSQQVAATSAVTARLAATAFTAFNRTFVRASGSAATYRDDDGSGAGGFWKQAEMIEMAEDAYQRSGDPHDRALIGALYQGFVAQYGTDWLGDTYNDDVMWMVIASLRAYQATGDPIYRDQAKWHFDRIFARGWSGDFGGGLWWTTARHEKNACVNAPAAIAAALLYQTLHDRSYLDKAERLYAWVRTRLYDTGRGTVLDHVSYGEGGAAVRDPSVYSYNQGTFIGAAGLLYQATGDRAYFEDALRTLAFTRDELTGANGILRSEGTGADGGGFKGVFARWAARFTRDNHITWYDAWFQRNAATAWRNRNAANAMDEDWADKTADAGLHAFDCSSAVVMLQVSPLGDTTPAP